MQSMMLQVRPEWHHRLVIQYFAFLARPEKCIQFFGRLVLEALHYCNTIASQALVNPREIALDRFIDEFAIAPLLHTVSRSIAASLAASAQDVVVVAVERGISWVSMARRNRDKEGRHQGGGKERTGKASWYDTQRFEV